MPEVFLERSDGELPARAVFYDRRRALERQKREGLLDPRLPDVDLRRDLGNREAGVGAAEAVDDLLDLVALRECRLDEPVIDPCLLVAAQEHPSCRLDGTACPADLLVVMHDRSRHLIVDHEGEVGFVIPHPERGRGDEGLDLVGKEHLLAADSLGSLVSGVVGEGPDPLRDKPAVDHVGIGHGERVDDPASRKLRHRVGEPCEPRGLVRKTDGLERKRRPSELPARHMEVAAEDRTEVIHHPVVGGSRRGQEPGIRWQCPSGPLDEPVVGAEVVAPVRDAVGLVDHQKRDRRGDGIENGFEEPLAREPLGRDEKDVDLVLGHLLGDFLPLVGVRGVDRGGTNAHPFGGGDLIPH